MSAKLLRAKYAAQFHGLSKNSVFRAWSVFGWQVAVIIAAVGSGSEVLAWDWHWVNPIIAAGIMLLIGTRLRALNNIVHECSHALFCQDRRTNELIGKSCGLFLMSCFRDYRDEHLTHHRHVGDFEHDLDLQGIQKLGLDDPLTPGKLAQHIVRPFLGLHLPYYLSISLSDRDGAIWKAAKIALLTLVFAAMFFAPVPTLLFVIIPFALIYTALNYWADCFDHAGIVPSDDELHAARNMLVAQPLRALFFPMNDSFHLVHHLFPAIPSQHLEKAHSTLTEDLTYRSCVNAVGRQSKVDLESELAP